MTKALAGLYLPQIRMDFAAIERRARVAEEAGFHSAWFIDHLAPPAARGLDMLDAWTVATAVAMRTERLHVGHLVLCAEFRHPAVLAKMAASLDVLSGGRLELGLGWGSVARELTDYGFADPGPEIRAARLAETIDVLRLLWTGEAVDFDGAHWTLRDAVCRPRPAAGRVPIHIGGAGRRLTMPLAAGRADWWNCPSGAADRLAELRPSARPGSPSSTRSAWPPHRPPATRSPRPRGAASARGAGSSPEPPTRSPPRWPANATPGPSCSSASSTTSAPRRRSGCSQRKCCRPSIDRPPST